MSRIRQNYREETEALVNKQINIQLTASYTYQALAAHFDRDDEAGPGYSEFFSRAAGDKRARADSLICYQNRRGGKVVFQDIARPAHMAWDSPLAAFNEALEHEKNVNESLLSTHRMAAADAHLCNYLESEFLGAAVETIQEISAWITKLGRVGPGLGYHVIDTEVA